MGKKNRRKRNPQHRQAQNPMPDGIPVPEGLILSILRKRAEKDKRLKLQIDVANREAANRVLEATLAQTQQQLAEAREALEEAEKANLPVVEIENLDEVLEEIEEYLEGAEEETAEP